MNKKKHALLFLLIFICFLLTGCSGAAKKNVREVIISELDQLKNLDLATAKQYISSENMFPDATESITNPELIEEFISLFFQDFDYEILDINVNETKAAASVRLYTLDAQALARDFSCAHLKEEILSAADSPNNTTLLETTLDEHYVLLNNLLEISDYETVESNCTINLVKADDTWHIQQTDSLENEFVGGFISNTSNPNLLTPSETLDVYFATFREMTEQQMINYWGLSQLLTTDGNTDDALTAALIDQVQKCFDYTISDTAQDGYTAIVNTDITTFDYNAIMAEYESSLNKYLEEPQALYDGEEGRLSKSSELMLASVNANTSTIVENIPVTLINDSISWKLQPDDTLINAIWGNFASSSLTASSAIEKNDSEGDYDSDFSEDYDSDYDSSEE